MLSNPKALRVRRAAALARKKERVAQARFLVEGPQAVRELLVHRPELAETVYATLGAVSWQHEIDRLASDAEVRLERVSDEVLAAVSETVHPQGVVAVARTWSTPVSEAVRGARLVAVLHEVRDPGNAGAVLRAADAAGADAVVFAGESIDPFHPKVVRSTTGSLFHLPVVVSGGLDELAGELRQAGLTLLAADVRGDDLLGARSEGVLAGAVAWIFGNEARGLSAQDRALADRSLKLPIFGAAESLNLATAASVILYETAFAQRRDA
ncbi:RNA methyltransferase [Leucobacter massiliensis]|uniref:RNA methyltransferase n=1 Tax=Leucobacter massiliensis TaxID=1686285 RepID=A0A2S9QP27_9MICO|nr:RNA methyltransferase [Leucobacter massiliensis]